MAVLCSSARKEAGAQSGLEAAAGLAGLELFLELSSRKFEARCGRLEGAVLCFGLRVEVGRAGECSIGFAGAELLEAIKFGERFVALLYETAFLDGKVIELALVGEINLCFDQRGAGLRFFDLLKSRSQFEPADGVDPHLE